MTNKAALGYKMVGVQVSPTLLQRIEYIAKSESRSRANMFVVLLKEAVGARDPLTLSPHTFEEND